MLQHPPTKETLHHPAPRAEVVSRVQLNTWCHQCKMRKPRVVCCDNFLFASARTPRCNGRYCDGCTARHYDEDVDELGKRHAWTCFQCRGRCACAACERKRKAEAPSAAAHDSHARDPTVTDDTQATSATTRPLKLRVRSGCSQVGGRYAVDVEEDDGGLTFEREVSAPSKDMQRGSKGFKGAHLRTLLEGDELALFAIASGDTLAAYNWLAEIAGHAGGSTAELSE